MKKEESTGGPSVVKYLHDWDPLPSITQAFSLKKIAGNVKTWDAEHALVLFCSVVLL